MQTFQQDLLQLTTKPVIYCKKRNQSSLACFNQDCKHYPFVCYQKDCQCQRQHEDCSMLVTDKLQKAIRKKIVTLKPLQNKIYTFFQQIIEKLSTYKEQLLLKLQKSFGNYFGLSQIQSEILKALDSEKYSQLNGQKLWYTQFHLKEKSQTVLKLGKKYQQIQKVLQKFQQETINFNFNLDQKIQYLEQGISWDSKIISTTEQQDVIDNFFGNKKIKSAQLLYRASQNGFQSSIFHKKCDNIKDTLVVCVTEFGKIIGGYTPLAWKATNQWQIDNSKSTFIFSLTNKHKFTPKITSNTQIYGQTTGGPYFSNNADLVICNKANQNYCTANINSCFGNSNYLMNNSNSHRLFSGSQTANFRLKQWQVFKVQFED